MATLTTTIDQHIGDHPSTGLRITALHTITTCADDVVLVGSSDLEDLHEAEVALASLDLPLRTRASEILEGGGAEDAAEIARMIRRAIAIACGERDGAEDYAGRAGDVAAGAEQAEWAWPYAGADDAYLSAIGTDGVMRSMGLRAHQWDEVCAAWCDAFRAGYTRAHDEAP